MSMVTLHIDDVLVSDLSIVDAPSDMTHDMTLIGQRSTLVITQLTGTAHRHVFAFEDGPGELRVRLHPSLALELDATVGERAIRFEPIILDLSSIDRPLTQGQGLFGRGLLFAGETTPSHVSLACVCDACRGSFRLQPFHAGFSDVGYFYSQSGRYTLVVPGSVAGSPVPLAEPDPDALAALEARLPTAPDGTRFSYLNPLRCPTCQAPYIDFGAFPHLRVNEYYGTTFFGKRALEFGG